MSVKKLSKEIQALVCASSNITSYKRAVEELVYNSLDAKATSIAIRIHIQENKIQVVDNGCGIAKKEYKLLGQRYATSKYMDLSSIKSAPDTYGFRGQALSNIMSVSKKVKITSRFENSEETWSKSFHSGKEQNLIEVASRPSKGTTVEISGFLYNANIQNKALCALQEIANIKTFLEQLSLVHSNISLTLRDDSTNEIIFKMHKNRDIYQKIKILFDIDKIDIQELQVEKNEYKTHAYIGKKCDEINTHHWIFLNKKLVKNTKLNKLLQQFFTKNLKLCNRVKNVKSKYAKDKDVAKKYIPFYIIFLSCPYYDYDISFTPKQSVLEFKDWKQITTLLEKLIKFYLGDINLKESKVQQNMEIMQETDIREKVREITRKFLGSNSKKIGVSQMQNGIKGQLIKRKKKKPKNIPTTETIPLQVPSIHLETPIDKIPITEEIQPELDGNIKVKSVPKQTQKSKLKIAFNKNKGDNYVKYQSNPKLNGNFKRDRERKNREKKSPKASKSKLREISKIKKSKKKKIIHKEDPLIKVFEKQPHMVKDRCNILATEAESLVFNKRSKQTVFVNETVNYSNIIKDNKNISIRKRVGEIIIHDIRPLQKKNESQQVHHKKPFKSSSDLLQPILGSEVIEYCAPNAKDSNDKRIRPYCTFNSKEIPQLTYQSHNYNNARAEVMSRGPDRKRVVTGNPEIEKALTPFSVSLPSNKKHKKLHFISKHSRENFAAPKITKKYPKFCNNKMGSFRKSHFNLKKYNLLQENLNAINISDVSRYTNAPLSRLNKNGVLADIESIHVDNTLLSTEIHNSNRFNVNDNLIYHDEIRHSVNTTNLGFTYTITSSNIVMSVDDYLSRNPEYTTDFRNNKIISLSNTSNKEDNSYKQNCENRDFISKSQNTNDIETNQSNIEPMTLCEAIVNNFDTLNQSTLNLNYESMYNFSPPNNAQNYNLSLQEHNSYFNDYISVSPQHQLPVYKDVLIDYDVNNENNIISDQEIPTNNPFDVVSIENHETDKIDHCDCITSHNVNDENNIITDQELPANNVIDVGTIEDEEINHCDCITESNYFNEQNIEKEKVYYNTEDVFNVRNRSRFVPKGMSPIFKNCNSKHICDYNFDEEYFENTMYDNFNNNVQTIAEVYEPRVQNTKDTTAKAIEKFNSRLEKDFSTLTFDSESLKGAKVLGQVDNKFIAAIMKRDSSSTNFLVLFDQHAVHERITLENNLSEYFNGNEWQSVNLEDMTLKMTKDEIMYLHNYRAKFHQFGLRWTIQNADEIKVHSIPFAILGQNPREVDKIMKTVKNLILEEINNIISQKGCVSLYPKSIMDLVSNEACRYAIMFGDTLSKKECAELLESLSTCKTPFQCAHGRPVLAVVMEFKPETHKYQINLKNVVQFKANKDIKK